MAKKAHVDVTLNGEEAKARLKEIGEELKKLKVLKDKFLQEGNASGVDSVNKEMKKLNGESAKLSKNITDVNSVLKNLSSASIQELNAALRVASRELNAMKRTDPGFADQQKKVNALRNELDNATGKAKQHQTSMAKLADGFNKYFGMATALVASFTGVILGFKAAAQEADDFEKKLDVLSSLTGLEGDELAYLSEQAKELSVSLVDNKIRITQSADAIVEAYTKMGSARPELLKNKEDLNSVTKEAMILAAAADSELEPAVNALAGVLNQFNYSASESRRIINTIAAGSKEGAGEIPYLTEAIEKSGTVAKDAGIEIEELVGIIETMAPRMTSPEVAGRNLRGMILKLQTGADDTNPSIVGFTKALDNLAAKNLTAAEMMNLFGLENITGAKILINNREEVKKYTQAVTDTNIALEQAAKNTDNNISKKQQARNELKLIIMELGEKLSPAIIVSTNGFTYLVKAIMAGIQIFRDHAGVIVTSTSAVIAYATASKLSAMWTERKTAGTIINTVVTKANTLAKGVAIMATQLFAAAQMLLTGNIRGAAQAMRVFNSVLLASPIGAAVAAIAAITVGIIMYIRKQNELTQTTKSLQSIQERVNVQIDSQTARLKMLETTLKNNNVALNQRKNALDEIKKMVPDYNASLSDEGKLINDNTNAIKKYLVELEKQTRYRAAQDELEELFKKKRIAEKELIQAQTDLRISEKLNSQSVMGGGGVLHSAASQYVDIANRANIVKSTLQKNVEIQKAINELNKEISKSSSSTFINRIDTEGRTLAKMEEELHSYQAEIKLAEVGSEKFKKIQTKISDLSKEIAKAQDSIDSTTKDVEKQIGAYQELTDSISKLEAKIKDLVAANKPVPDSLIHQLTSKKEELKQVEETIKGIGNSIAVISAKRAGLIPENDPALGVADKRSGHSEVNIGEKYSPDEEEERKQAALSIADSTQNAIFSIVRNKQQAEFDHKMSLLEKQRDAELSNENLTEAQKDKIREKYRKKEAALKLEQWKKQKAADLVQAMIKGALSVITAMSQMGPIGAIVAGAAVAAEIAVIAAAKPPEFKGGGFTDNSSSDDEPAGMVHANEFVANAYATRNPSVRKVLNIIDIAQKTGSIRSMNLPAMIASTEYERKLKAGGYVTRSTIKEPVPNELYNSSEIIDAIDRFGIYVDKMQTIKIEAEGKWIYQDFKEMKEKEDLLIAKTA